jgi:hypothetical protein
MRTFLLLILFAGVANAEIYKWTDENGQVHFGDKAPQKAKIEKIEMDPFPEAAKPLSTESKVWKQKATTSQYKSSYQRKVAQSEPAEVKRDSFDCDYAKDQLRYYEYEWNNKRTRGYKQSERNYYMDKINYYKAEIKHEC